METLFINACVRSDSRTLALCRRYLDRSPDDVREIELDTLGLMPIDGRSLEKRNGDIARRDFSGPEYDLAKAFTAADEVVIAAPYWDYSFPSMLKVFFEHICVTGLTFHYVDGRPTGLCRAKKLRYFVTSGGFIGQNSSLELYLKELCVLFDIPDLKIYKAEGLDIDGADTQAILDDAMRTIECN